MPPTNVAGANPMKTLHNRTKSTSALSSLLKNPIKGNSQRRAFADVSNTVRTGAQAKDDLILADKGTYDALPLKTLLQPLKEVPDISQQQQRPTALLRPAQRPLSAIVQKALPAVPVSTTASAVPKHVVTEPSCDVANIRKVLSRRNTTVFKETVPFSTTASAASQNASTQQLAPVHQILEAKEKPVPSNSEQVATNGVLLESAGVVLPTDIKECSEDLIQSIEQTFANSEKLHALDDQLQHPPAAPSRTSSSETIEQLQTSEGEVYLPAVELQGAETEAAVVLQQPIAEVQEYWEEDEDEEYYDAEGYTTARSFRSRGDNTTGGLTMLLEPRVTARSIKELEQAKIVVDLSRTEEDIEDEAWDTSMVAEYGDEIFQYMHELEVSCGKAFYRGSQTNMISGSNEAKWQLHGEPSRDSMVYARSPHGLAHPGPRSIPIAARDSLPRSQLCRSVPVLQGGLLGQAPTRRCNRHLCRCKVRRDQLPLRAGDCLHGGWWLHGR